MQLRSIKTTLATVWITAVGVAGLAVGFQSFWAWTVLAGVAILPPLVMMRRWNHPGPTMSESIQKARR